MRKRIVSAVLLFLMLTALSGCDKNSETEDSGGLNIVTTVFPAYDFAREIAGERTAVMLLVPPGAEAHSFEPTPQDIIRIQNCDLLICNGGESEAWLEEILEGFDEPIHSITMLACVDALEEETKEGMQSAGHEHHDHEDHDEHEEHHEHVNHDEHEDHEAHREHETEYDEHVWTSPINAKLISEAICDALCTIDAVNAEEYRKNCADFCAELMELDKEIRSVIDNASCKTMIFADRFPVRYFVEEYGLEYYAAFPGCAEDAEPSAKTVAFLIDRVREHHTPAVFYIEFSNEKMADIICEDTGCEKYLFHSCHNVSADQLREGISYLELFRRNVTALKEALG